MSTKASIAYDDNFHLYEEVMDDANVFFELSGQSVLASIHTEAGYCSVTVCIPRSIMNQVASEYLKDTLVELIASNPALHLTSSNEMIRECAEEYVRNSNVEK
jgi:hypothetical protein